ncbi:MAG: hypothetical protein K0R03_623 [Moraxellaceae bacterium]|jgi:uncharacterized membrane protein|nr:hypothetical protein [Moraxellaceae bacterium]
MAFFFALAFALMVMIAGRWRGDDFIMAFIIGLALALGAWLTRLIDKRIRRIGSEMQETSKRPGNVQAVLEDIHWRLKRLEEAQGLGPSPMEAARETPATTAPGTARTTTVAPAAASPAAAVAPVPATASVSTPASASAAKSAPAPSPWQSRPAPAATPSGFDTLIANARAWLLGGNTVVRVGIIVLFFGVAFLLRFASQHNMVPPELRVAGIGAGAIALLVIGWRLRGTRHNYALALQGAGVGLLYLTLFGAFRLYHLVPPAVALLALIAVAVLSALLALLQDSRALMSIGVTGGFLAPVLASTGSGNHVLLFSYYAVLNFGIFAVAWFKAWRPLNLLGFFFTFGIGLTWGVKAYRPELFASTEPFLILFFAMFLVISVLFAQRQSESLSDWVSEVAEGRLPRRIVDSTLVFGLPLVAFGFQAGLTRDMEFALAYSALTLSAIYLGLGRWLLGRGHAQLQLLTESFLALGVIFGTLAIPLALDARWTSASWSLEGAALVWVGLHQQRRLGRWFGLFLQFAAAIAWTIQPGYWRGSEVPVLNAFCLGAALVALAALFSAWQMQKHAQLIARPWERWLALPVFLWGVLWWLVAGLGEGEHLLGPAAFDAFTTLFLAASAAAFLLLSPRLQWPQARLPAAALPIGLGLVFLHALDNSAHAFAQGGWLTWPLALLLHFSLLRKLDAADDYPGWRPIAHALGFWLLAALGSSELYWLAQDQALAGGWTITALIVVPGLLMLALCRGQMLAHWPLRDSAPSYLGLGSFPLLGAFALWCLLTDFTHNGPTAPLPYLPLLNPVDLGHVFLGLLAVRWALLVQAHSKAIGVEPDFARWRIVLGVLAFTWVNAMLLRSIHHWAHIPYTPGALFASNLVQAALSLFWTLLALALMATAAQRAWRNLWMTGAGLMGVVVLKLFLVDLDSVGSVARIVSFLGVGLLMLLIGYLAPVPPRAASTTEPTP